MCCSFEESLSLLKTGRNLFLIAKSSNTHTTVQRTCMGVGGVALLLTLRLRSGGLLQSVCLCVCACVLPSVCPPFFSVTAATPSVKRGHIIKLEACMVK